jgi:hypothetical protein
MGVQPGKFNPAITGTSGLCAENETQKQHGSAPKCAAFIMRQVPISMPGTFGLPAPGRTPRGYIIIHRVE